MSATSDIQARLAALEQSVAELQAAGQPTSLQPNDTLVGAGGVIINLNSEFLQGLQQLTPSQMLTARALLGIPASGAGAAQLYGIPSNPVTDFEGNWGYAALPTSQDSGLGLVTNFGAGQGLGFTVTEAGWYAASFIQVASTGVMGLHYGLEVGWFINGAIYGGAYSLSENVFTQSGDGDAIAACVAWSALLLETPPYTLQPAIYNNTAAVINSYSDGFASLARVA